VRFVSVGSLFFLEEPATTGINDLLRDLRKFVQQPGQRHFQLHVIIGDVNMTRSHLAKRPDPKNNPVWRPCLLLDDEHRKTGGDLAWRRPDAAHRLRLAELVRDLDGKGLTHRTDQ
jgi:hypothetical protein